MTDKMPPLPPILREHFRGWEPSEVAPVYAYASQYAAEVAGPLVEALQGMYALFKDYAERNHELLAVEQARAALAAYKEHTKHG